MHQYGDGENYAVAGEEERRLQKLMVLYHPPPSR